MGFSWGHELFFFFTGSLMIADFFEGLKNKNNATADLARYQFKTLWERG